MFWIDHSLPGENKAETAEKTIQKDTGVIKQVKPECQSAPAQAERRQHFQEQHFQQYF
jgi:hypothetical protein